MQVAVRRIARGGRSGGTRRTKAGPRRRSSVSRSEPAFFSTFPLSRCSLCAAWGSLRTSEIAPALTQVHLRELERDAASETSLPPTRDRPPRSSRSTWLRPPPPGSCPSRPGHSHARHQLAPQPTAPRRALVLSPSSSSPRAWSRRTTPAGQKEPQRDGRPRGHRSRCASTLSPRRPAAPSHSAGLTPPPPPPPVPLRSQASPAPAKVKRKRNRAALSCSACKKRKIKCDRKLPCEACIKRGEQGSCRWEQPKVEPPPCVRLSLSLRALLALS